MKAVVSIASLLLLVPTSWSVGADAPETLDLNTALALALENNFGIRSARAAHEQAAGVETTSEAGGLPTVTASGRYTRIAGSLIDSPGGGGFSFGSESSWQAGVEAQQTIYSGGAVGSAIQSSRLAREAAAGGFSEAVWSALLQVRINFYSVLLAREQVEVREQSVKLLEEELANARARVRAGSGSPFDELRAEVALANGQPPLIRARNAYRVAAVDLLRAIGLSPDEEVAGRVTGELNYQPREISLAAALASARENRPQLLQLEKLVDASEASVDTARAGSRPSVAVVGGYSIQKSQFSSSDSDTIDGWNLGVQTSWNIFDGRATRGRVRQARASVNQARLNLEDAELAIEADVRRSYASYNDAIELVNSSRRVVEQAEESLRLARSRFGAGAATQLDVFQAEVALTEARSNVAQALHDVNVAYAYLERSAALAPLPAGATIEEE